MKFWNSSTSTTGDGDEKENTSNGKYIPPTTCKSQRFYYERGGGSGSGSSSDDQSQLKLFKGLSRNINQTLRSLFLERCIVNSSVFLSSLEGCEILTSIKLYDVSIQHDQSLPKNPQKLTLPSLKVLHVHDLLSDSDSTVKEISFDTPFDKILDPSELTRLEKFVQFHVKFYLQLLHLSEENECKSLLCKFHSSDIDFSLKLKGYQILKYSPLEQYEKLVISPLVPSSAYPPHCSNGSHQLFSQLKYLACSDHHLSLSTTPKNLVELNLYVTSKTATLIVDLAMSQKLSSSVTSLTLHLKTATIIDLKMLSSGLGRLEELVIVNGIVHSTATSPLTVTTACFDRCSFSEAFMKNVSRFLNCERIGIDVGGVRNWNGVFKSNIMSMSAVRSIFVWAVDRGNGDGEEKGQGDKGSDSNKGDGDGDGDDKITFSEIFEKRPSPKSVSSNKNIPLIWAPRKFENVESRRYILLNQRDFYPPPKTGVFQPNLFGGGGQEDHHNVSYSSNSATSTTIPPAFTDKSNFVFATLIAVAAIIFYIYSGFTKKQQ